MKITVFGSSKPREGDPDYEDARQLGARIAVSGHTVVTGGYMGTMEAVSRGAAEVGGHVIGVTCAQIERWRNAGANPWVCEELRCETLNERLDRLITICDAAIALPGGPGTLVEVSLFWNLLAIQALPPRPLVLVGAAWRDVFEHYRRNLGDYVNPSDWSWLLFAADARAALNIINSAG